MLKKKLNAKKEARLQEIMRRGHMLEKSQQYAEAIAEYQKVLEIDRSNLAACQLLGMLYHKQGQNELAAPLIAKVVKAEANKADIQCAYAAILSAIGNHHESSIYYKKAIELSPNYMIAHFNYSQELVYLGKIDAAISSFRRVLEIEPRCAGAYQQLARISDYSEYNDDIQIMEDLYKTAVGDERKILAFGLSVAYKKIRRFEESFECLLEGNRLQRKSLDYSPEGSEKVFSELQEIFTSELITTHSAQPTEDFTPIFILGMPRSGTTLAEQILASHSAVHGAGELTNLGKLYQSICVGTSSVSTTLKGISEIELTGLAKQYTDELRKFGNGEPYITDKMPHNFLYVGLITMLFPTAKIIHCERDPLDTCLSIFTNLFTGSHSYAYKLEELGHYYLLYKQLMAHWQKVVPGRIYTLNYERVVGNTDQEVKMLLNYVGLPFEESCLSFFDTDRAVVTVSASQVRQPIYQSSVGGWRRFERGLEPLRKILLGVE